MALILDLIANTGRAGNDLLLRTVNRKAFLWERRGQPAKDDDSAKTAARYAKRDRLVAVL